MFVYFFFLLVQIKNKCDVFIFFLYYFLNSVFFFFAVYKIIICAELIRWKFPPSHTCFSLFTEMKKKSLIRSAIFSTPNLYSQPHPFICLWLITLKKKSPFLFEFLFCLNFFIFHSRFQIVRSYNLSCLITFYVLDY